MSGIAPDELTRKVCHTCRESKLLRDYHRNQSRRDGLRPDCKTCRRASYAKRPDPGLHQCGTLGCDVLVTGRHRICSDCRGVIRRIAEATAPELPIKPNVCNKVWWNGVCGQVMLEQVTRDGLMVFVCVRHGEQAVPRIYPGHPAHPSHRRPGRPKKSEFMPIIDDIPQSA